MSGAVSAKSSTDTAAAQRAASPLAGQPAPKQMLVKLQNLTSQDIKAAELAGEPILGKLTRAPGNQAPIGGLKVITANGWFAAWPSGTENLYKIYAESFRDQSHLDALVNEAQQIVNDALL